MDESREELNEIIQKLCTSGSQILDVNLMKKLKSICRDNDKNIEICYDLLITEFKKLHSEIRYSALQITDYLFERSCRFRELILDDFQTFLEFIFDVNKERPVPPPQKVANDLKKLGAMTIKKWNDKFGNDYKVLNLGFNYLKNCKKIDFVEFNHQSIAERQNTVEINRRKEIQANIAADKCIEEMNEKENDIRGCIQQLDRCFNILVPKPDDIFEEFKNPPKTSTAAIREEQVVTEILTTNVTNDDSDTDDDDFVEVKLYGDEEVDDDEELRYLGFLNGRDSEYTRGFELKLDLKLKQNEENRVLIEIIKDLYKEIKYSHLDVVNNWIKNLSAVKTATEKLKHAIELKNSLQLILKNIDGLGIDLSDTKPKNKKIINESSSVNKPIASTISKKRSIEGNDEDSESKKKMLEIAPVFQLDEIQLGVSVSSKIDVSHPFYQKNEVDHSKEVMPTLAKKVFIGKFEPVQWKCRAPLANGKLCERMDRIKCPFHGKVIGRDGKTGKATNPKEETLPALKKKEEIYNPLGDAAFLRDIESQTGKDLGSAGKNSRKKKKTGNLTNLNAREDTPRKRLERKLCNSSSLRRIGSILDSIEQRQHLEKFHHNFNYSISQ